MQRCAVLLVEASKLTDDKNLAIVFDAEKKVTFYFGVNIFHRRQELPGLDMSGCLLPLDTLSSIMAGCLVFFLTFSPTSHSYGNRNGIGGATCSPLLGNLTCQNN